MQSLKSSTSVFRASKPGKAAGSGRAWPAVKPRKQNNHRSTGRLPVCFPHLFLQHDKVNTKALMVCPCHQIQMKIGKSQLGSHTVIPKNMLHVEWHGFMFHDGFMMVSWFHGFMFHGTHVYIYTYIYNYSYLLVYHIDHP